MQFVAKFARMRQYCITQHVIHVFLVTRGPSKALRVFDVLLLQLERIIFRMTMMRKEQGWRIDINWWGGGWGCPSQVYGLSHHARSLSQEASWVYQEADGAHKVKLKVAQQLIGAVHYVKLVSVGGIPRYKVTSEQSATLLRNSQNFWVSSEEGRRYTATDCCKSRCGTKFTLRLVDLGWHTKLDAALKSQLPLEAAPSHKITEAKW